MTPEQLDKFTALRRASRGAAFSDWDRAFLDTISGKVNEPLREWQASQLNCMFRQLKPAQHKTKPKPVAIADPPKAGMLF